MSEPVIEKGIPVPPDTRGKRALAKTMNVGDSVLFSKASQASYLVVALRKNGMKGTMRSLPEGYRVWRVG